jgi:TPR repeat protein
VKLLARTNVILLTIVTLALSAPARSDYQTGVDAYSNGNFKAALEQWLPLAEAGDATAQNSVGALYDHGLGVDEDDATAAYWYQLAADQNLPLAMRNLANMYVGGYGVPFDQDLAEIWYEKAASMGDPVAIKRMATLRPSGEFAAAAEPLTVAEAAAPAAPAAEPMTVVDDSRVAETVPEAPAEPVAPAAEPMTVVDDGQDAETVSTAPVAAPQATSAAPQPAEAPAPGAPESDLEEPLQYGDVDLLAPAAGGEPLATPATTQQAAVAPPPPSEPGNWLIGMWQGPSLGCPPDGGMEFAPGETRSYYGGAIAARLQAQYDVAGDRVTVTSIGVDGVGHSYEYERRGPDTFVIAKVPADMPSSMIGVEHRRCGSAPQAAPGPQEADAALVAAPEPAPEPEAAMPVAKPFVPAAPVPEAQPLPKAQPVPPVAEAPQPAPVAGAEQATAPADAAAGSVEDGWQAFGRGDYVGALAIWEPIAERGDVSMQLLVASIYDFGQGVPQDDAAAVKWYELAAAQGSAKGQYQAGAVYARSPQVKDPVQGYKWLTIAAGTLANGPQSGITADQATTLRTLIEGEMSPDEIAQAKAAADAFKATKG